MSAVLKLTDWTRPVVDTVKLDLPMPPSVNALWRKGRSGMYRSPSYMTWINAAGTLLNTQRPGRIEGDYVLVLKLQRKNDRKRDADNFLKAVSDLLVLHGVVADDSLAQAVTAMWSPGVVGCQVVVTAIPSVASKTLHEEAGEA